MMKLTRIVHLAGALLLAVLVTGCAHPISLTPNLANVAGSGASKIEKKVGLIVVEDDLKREIIGPGGGGDKVRYLPYRDLEAGIYVALSESFTQVAKVTGVGDPKVAAEGIDYLVTPILVTTSYSPSLVTWPPTIFTIELTCKLSDAQGKPVAEVKVTGEGRAEYVDFRGDFSLAAKRAAEDVLKRLVRALGEAAPRLR